MTCRCGHGRQWHRKAQLSGWQRQRGERTTKTIPCTFRVRKEYPRLMVAKCPCRNWHPQEATR